MSEDPSIGRVGVLGCGLMGSGIAQVCAQAGFETVVYDISTDTLESGLHGVHRRIDRLVEKGTITPTERKAAIERLRGTTSLQEMDSADIILEAVVEDLPTKNALWTELNGICPEQTIFASNTSSIPITDMAGASGRPDRLVGLHFFNPVPVMPLVEVVRTILTTAEVFDRCREFVAALGKEAIVCRDSPGFVVNRLLVPFMMDAIRALEQGLATVEDIDRAMRLGAGHPMGPLTLCDFVGNDTLERIGEIMFAEFRDPRFAPPPLLKRMNALGLSGRKSGKGFYDYSMDPPQPNPGLAGG